jgi:hypothetical protein
VNSLKLNACRCRGRPMYRSMKFWKMRCISAKSAISQRSGYTTMRIHSRYEKAIHQFRFVIQVPPLAMFGRPSDFRKNHLSTLTGPGRHAAPQGVLREPAWLRQERRRGLLPRSYSYVLPARRPCKTHCCALAGAPRRGREAGSDSGEARGHEGDKGRHSPASEKSLTACFILCLARPRPQVPPRSMEYRRSPNGSMCRRADRDRHRARRNSAFRLARRTITKTGRSCPHRR